MSAREHGTRARYVLGPDENGIEGKGCHCAPCTQANRAAENQRSRLIAYGQWQPYVDAGPSRQHVRMLSEHGIGWKRAAELAGISTGAMSKLLYGGPGDRPPSRRIRPATAAAILAVQPALHALGGSARVEGTGTSRRLQALVAIGWSQSKLATRLGMTPSNFTSVIRGEPVRAATARAVTRLYGELWNRMPPEAAHRDKIAASRARNMARTRGWAPPLAWDDDQIDDPAASPAEGWQRPARLLRRGPELAEDIREVVGQGHTLDHAAERLGVTRQAAQKAIERYRRSA